MTTTLPKSAMWFAGGARACGFAGLKVLEENRTIEAGGRFYDSLPNQNKKRRAPTQRNSDFSLEDGSDATLP